MESSEVVNRATEAGVQLIFFLYCDNGGIIRGKSTHVSTLAKRLESGIGLTMAMQAMSDMDQLQAVAGMGPVGEIRLVPDLDTFTVLPYAPRRAVMLSDMVTLDRVSWGACPRDFLKRMVARASARGLKFMAAFEPEWTLATREGDAFVPCDQSLCFSTIGANTALPVIDDLELKPSDSSANPYIALGGLLAAGLDGVEAGLLPQEGHRVDVDPSALAPEELAQRGIQRLPSNLAEAIEALERDEVLMEALGAHLSRSYLAIRRGDLDLFSSEDETFELEHHFYKY